MVKLKKILKEIKHLNEAFITKIQFDKMKPGQIVKVGREIWTKMGKGDWIEKKSKIINTPDNMYRHFKNSYLSKKKVTAESKLNEALPKFKSPLEAYKWIMNKRGEAMDIEQEMMDTNAEIQQLYGEMEQEAEAGGGPIADRYGRDIEALEDQHKDLRAQLDMIMAEIDEYDQNY